MLTYRFNNVLLMEKPIQIHTYCEIRMKWIVDDEFNFLHSIRFYMDAMVVSHLNEWQTLEAKKRVIFIRKEELLDF